MNFLGTFGQVLLTSALVLSLFRIAKHSPIIRWTALGISAAIGFFKIGDLRLIAYPAGVVGDLSITTQVLLAAVVMRQVLGIDILSERDRFSVLVAAGAVGLALYPLSSGLTILDVYSWGFESTALMIGLVLLAVVAWYVRPGAALVIPLSVIAFNFELLASNNIWDYLTDPIITVFAWGWMFFLWMSRALATTRPSADARP